MVPLLSVGHPLRFFQTCAETRVSEYSEHPTRLANEEDYQGSEIIQAALDELMTELEKIHTMA